MLANLSKRAQYVELDLAEYRGMVPTELRGDTAFPSIGELPYFVTLGPYEFYWFSLSQAEQLDKTQWLLRDQKGIRLPARPRQDITQEDLVKHFERLLADYLPKARWFAGKGKQIRKVRILDRVELDHHESPNTSTLVFVEVQYRDDKETVETYLLTVTRAEGDRAENILRDRPDLVIGEYEPVSDPNGKGIYHEAMIDAGFAKALFLALLKRKDIDTLHGSISAETYLSVKREWIHPVPDPALMSLEQSNSSLRFGKNFFLKLFRKLEDGVNPEVEIGEHLTKIGFAHAPHLIGSMQYNVNGKTFTLAVLHQNVESVSTAWGLLQHHLENFAEEAAPNNPVAAKRILVGCPSLFDLDASRLPAWFIEETAYTASLVKLLGQRTGELHRALGDTSMGPDFVPEDITPFYQRSLYQSLRNRAARTRLLLEQEGGALKDEAKALKDKLLKNWQAVEGEFRGVKTGPNLGGKRIRIHGDYHLGQVLFTGKDFVILDFEGEPMRPLTTRRLKHSPLQDVAGMLRSIDYAIFYYARQKLTRQTDREKLAAWLKVWRLWMSNQFFAGYLEACKDSDLLPPKPENARYLTEVLLLEKALYEVGYELGSRPDWVGIPLQGTLDMLPTLSSSKDKDGAA